MYVQAIDFGVISYGGIDSSDLTLEQGVMIMFE